MAKTEENLATLQARLDRLLEAIRAHRRNVWGDRTVEHPEDAALYAVLEEGANADA